MFSSTTPSTLKRASSLVVPASSPTASSAAESCDSSSSETCYELWNPHNRTSGDLTKPAAVADDVVGKRRSGSRVRWADRRLSSTEDDGAGAGTDDEDSDAMSPKMRGRGGRGDAKRCDEVDADVDVDDLLGLYLADIAELAGRRSILINSGNKRSSVISTEQPRTGTWDRNRDRETRDATSTRVSRPRSTSRAPVTRERVDRPPSATMPRLTTTATSPTEAPSAPATMPRASARPSTPVTPTVGKGSLGVRRTVASSRPTRAGSLLGDEGTLERAPERFGTLRRRSSSTSLMRGEGFNR
ncbi:hypothetical protein HK101_002658 [Irineochytrium annulatum]|nr:hypothetical protein HK101_002658 [Irineochytrium annulatum]